MIGGVMIGVMKLKWLPALVQGCVKQLSSFNLSHQTQVELQETESFVETLDTSYPTASMFPKK